MHCSLLVKASLPENTPSPIPKSQSLKTKESTKDILCIATTVIRKRVVLLEVGDA